MSDLSKGVVSRLTAILANGPLDDREITAHYKSARRNTVQMYLYKLQIDGLVKKTSPSVWELTKEPGEMAKETEYATKADFEELKSMIAAIKPAPVADPEPVAEPEPVAAAKPAVPHGLCKRGECSHPFDYEDAEGNKVTGTVCDYQRMDERLTLLHEMKHAAEFAGAHEAAYELNEATKRWDAAGRPVNTGEAAAAAELLEVS